MADTKTSAPNSAQDSQQQQDKSSNANATASTNADKSTQESPVFKVTRPDGRRVHFEGTEEDARAYLQANYPRVHVEPNANYGEEGPPPDAVLVDSSGSKEFFDGKDWQDVKESK